MGRIKINNAYKPLYTSDKRYFLLTGGRASLKSTTIHDFSSRLSYESGHGILVTRYTMTSAEKSIIPEFESQIKKNGSFKDFHKKGNKYVNLKSGSFILFSGIKTSSGDQTANLKSLHGITTWIIDEGEDFTDEATFDDIDDSIRSSTRQNRVIWVQNPSTKEHFIYDRWIDGNAKQIEVEGVKILVSNHPDVEAIHTTYHIAERAGYLGESWLKKVRKIKETNPEKYKHKYIGGWLDKAEGVIYDNWELGDFPDIPYIFGLDFGFSPDPTAMVKVGVHGKTIYLEECFYKTNLSTGEIEENIRRYSREEDLIVADNAEKRLINELITRGLNVIPCQKGKDSIKNGIGLIKDYKLVVKGDNLVRELNNYVWNDKKSSTPVDDYNHLADAFRYATVRLLEGFFVL